jgi:hypothetical protein
MKAAFSFRQTFSCGGLFAMQISSQKRRSSREMPRNPPHSNVSHPSRGTRVTGSCSRPSHHP